MANNKQTTRTIILIAVFFVAAVGSIILHKKVKDSWAENLTSESYIWRKGTLTNVQVETVTKRGSIVDKTYLLSLSGEEIPFKTYSIMYMSYDDEDLFSSLEEGNMIEVKVLKDQYMKEGHWGSNPIKTIYFAQPNNPIIFEMKINGYEVPQEDYRADTAIWIFRGWRSPFAVLAPAIVLILLGFIIISIGSKKRKKEKQDLNNYPDDLKEKIIASQKGYALATEIDSLLTKNFAIRDLKVVTTADKNVIITGVVESETEKQKIQDFLFQSDKVNELTNNLTVRE